MNRTGHYKKVCRNCGRVVEQCRCPDSSKPVEYVDSCGQCGGKQVVKSEGKEQDAVS
jgi:rRNA maturation endonuclease Nob1